MENTAYIIFTVDGVDQIVAAKTDCARALRELRAEGCDVFCAPVPWGQQDEMTALIEDARIDMTSPRKLLKLVAAKVLENARAARAAQEVAA